MMQFYVVLLILIFEYDVFQAKHLFFLLLLFYYYI